MTTHRTSRRGIVFVAALWVTLILAGLVLVFARSMRVEAAASAHHRALAKAAAVERGAEQYVLAAIEQSAGDVLRVVEAPAEAMRVGDGYFWILRVDPDQHVAPSPSAVPYRFGIVDENSKLNINRGGIETLTKMTGITEELAAAIIDWRDRDADTTPGGAESDYYLTLPVPYYAKDFRFETLEELLLVRSVTRDLLYGGEISGAAFAGPVGYGYPDRGIAHLLTVYGLERNVSESGDERVNINGVMPPVFNLLRETLSEERYPIVVQRVMAVRLTDRGRFRNPIDFYYRSGLTLVEFRLLVDRITTTRRQNRRGLINVNTAPAEVLYTLPQLDETDIAALMVHRSAPDADLSSIAWVIDALSEEKAIAIGGRITTRSSHYSAEILSVDGSGRAFRRSRIVVDGREDPAVIIYRQDLSDRGWPLEQDILDTLRRGGELRPAVSPWQRTRS